MTAHPRPLPEPWLFAEQFELTAVVGHGAAGTVYKGRHLKMRYDAAVKVYRGVVDDQEVEQFTREAARAARLVTPALVDYRDWGVTPKREMWLGMIWQRGETLRSRLRTAPLTLKQAVWLGRDLVWALYKMHEAGLAHRNIKPENIFCPPGFPDPVHPYTSFVLSDIAVARAPTRASSVVDPVFLHQARGFMAPEHARTGESSPASDVYSFGAVLFLCLAGCMPFPEDDDPTRGEWRVDRREAPRLVDLRPGVPRRLSDLIARMLAFDPADRPTMEQVWSTFPREREELGWDEDQPPPPVARAPSGERRAVAVPRPSHPLTDRLLHRELLRLLRPRVKDDDVYMRVAAVAQNHLFHHTNRAVTCALCGRFLDHCAFTDLLPRGHRHLSHAEASKATPPTVCTDCLRMPWKEVHAAIQDSLTFLSAGDLDAPVEEYGPSRRTLRDALGQLYLKSTPHLDPSAPCARCGRTGPALVGAWMNLCLRCFQATVDARRAWQEAQRRAEQERFRKAYAALVIRGEERAGSRGVRRRSRESDIALPPSPGLATLVLITLRHTAGQPRQDRAEVDDLAEKLAVQLEHHALMGAIVKPDKEICPGGAYHGDSILPGIVCTFLASQTISPGPRERLLVAAATVAEALQDGARYYGKDDDNTYEDQTAYWRCLAALF